LLSFVAESLPSSLPFKNIKINIYRTIILPVVLYECETWSLTLREESGVMVLENSVLRRIFGSKSDKIKGECRKLHNEVLNDLYCSPHIIQVIKSRRMRLAGHIARMGKMCKQGFGGETRGKEPTWKTQA